ncbi:LacI family DNA-binding transcriptional regulator [Nocardioides bizhenqiangii]|uniref:LacI family DNA-binding transcriptional regulator n=1 Tax=Nocardioides bizhenqiangii TaxID=3095076 RepID=A0ABZ0ZSA8_9ACTN|nr:MULTISPECIES: LacI family DNA-binding transcriptional regulator [unclassified Nocardioides]MDZ5622105.1 LacI family DNA-binding transcriptional regulator [Nocardioides sp. HM23]WQQ27223.1 LacI family DNA-binding transcriptional regulator [Nocardioides sp. HM61]
MAKPQSSVRLQDVAEEAGVSIATASRSLSGTAGVSESVAERVREVAQRMGYVVNVHARSLAAGTSRSVGLVVHEIGDPYFAEIASGVLRVGTREGLTVQICHSGRDPDRELEQIRMLVANRVGAIIIAGSGFVDPALQAAAKRDLQAYRDQGGRVAVIGRHHLGVDAVLPENVKGGRAIADHLIGLGHRRIAVATGSTALTTIADRLAGVEEACAEAGISFADVPVVVAEFTREGGKLAAEEILRDHPDVTAVLSLNDDMAIGVLSVLRARGVAVPERMSVSGFDDVAVAGDLAPSLTTIRLPMVTMGELALELALKAPGNRPRRRSAGHELVVRDSTAPPPA